MNENAKKTWDVNTIGLRNECLEKPVYRPTDQTITISVGTVGWLQRFSYNGNER